MRGNVMKLLRLNGKQIGYIIGRTLTKSGKQVVLFRSMDGFGMPKELIDSNLESTHGVSRRETSEASNFNLVEIHYQDHVYQAPVRTFREKGIPYHKPPYEPQYVLPRSQFTAIDVNQMRLV